MRYYVLYLSSRKAANLSRKCHQIYRLLTEEDRTAIDKQNNCLESVKVPSDHKIKEWLVNQINKIKQLKNVDVSGESLDELIKRFCHERQVKDDD